MGDNLLKNATSGIYFLASARHASLESTANRQRFHYLTADISDQTDIDSVLRQLGKALQFPIWYGANFDALYDCLTDPDWLPAKGHLLLINGLSALRTADPDDFATLIEVLRAACESRRDMQSPFWILIDTPARGIASLSEA